MIDPAFQSILFPVDFSDTCDLTAAHVCALASQSDATVTLLHVVPWLSAWYGESELRGAIAGDTGLCNLEIQQLGVLEAFQKKHFSGVKCRCEVRSGAVAETITDTADSLAIDLIMMPTRGSGRTRPFLIGSTTAKVLHDSHCAVWTSPHLADINTFQGYKYILCMLDQADIPVGYVEEAERLAMCFGAELQFVTAVPSIKAADDEQAHSQDCCIRARGRSLFVDGAVGDVIRQLTQTVHADLVLANRGHLQQPFGKFRTHAYEIVLESRCPVISLCTSSQRKLPDQTHQPETASI